MVGHTRLYYVVLLALAFLYIFIACGRLLTPVILSAARSYGDQTITLAHRVTRPKTADGELREKIIHFDTDPSRAIEVAESTNAIQGDGRIVHGTPADAPAAMELENRIYDANESWHGGLEKDP